MEFINEYCDTEWQAIRNEFKRIQDINYLDHAGTTLYSEKQLSDINENLSKNLYCNPHTSKSTEDLIDQVRYKILKHFNTNSNEYQVIFTSGTTGSLKLIGESFNFNENCGDDRNDNEESGQFLYLRDNHTSVLGMRAIVNTKNIQYIEKLDFLNNNVKTKDSTNDNNNTNSLFVYPAQCNFSGFKYPLDVIKSIQLNGFNETVTNKLKLNKSTNWFICLDAASFASTNYLDLNKYPADFVCISFYKLFGYPTGLGALLVSERGVNVIDKKYYGGGTVKISLSSENWHRKRDCFYERMEDGTIPFLSIISLLQGFQTLERLILPSSTSSSLPINNNNNNKVIMERISKHCFNLTNYLIQSLLQLKYKNGNAIVKLYHDNLTSILRETQGGIVNFNVLHDDGSYVGFAEIACMASIHNIYLRTGCFCNPGSCQRHLDLTNDELRLHYKAGHICGDSNDLIDGIPTGSVRISFGYMTEKHNVDGLIDMIKKCYLRNENRYILNNINIKEQYKLDPKFNHQQMDQSLLRPNRAKTFPIKLKQICIYPLKSCGSYKISSKWPLNRKGLKYDREWMIINSNGVALTQKSETKLCLIVPTILLNENVMLLNYPNKCTIRIPLNLMESLNSEINDYSLCQSKVCGDRIDGIDCGDEISNWLSDALQIQGLRLIRQSDDDHRIIKKYKPLDDQEQKHTIALSNQAQFLLINSMSVDWLARKVEDWNELEQYTDDDLQYVIDRFRGNLIVETPVPLDELTWKYINFGNLKLKAEGPCTRCQMICIDQRNGTKTTEPLRTIAKEFQGKLKFGLYLSQINANLDNLNSKEIYINCNDSITIEQ